MLYASLNAKFLYNLAEILSHKDLKVTPPSNQLLLLECCESSSYSLGVCVIAFKVQRPCAHMACICWLVMLVLQKYRYPANKPPPLFCTMLYGMQDKGPGHICHRSYGISYYR